MKSHVLATSVIVASAVSAAVVFPDADESHDVGSAAAWGGERPSGKEIEVKNAGTYYLGSDYTVGATFWTAEAAGTTVYDFTRDGNHTLTATTFREDAANRTVEYRGGVMRGAYSPHSWNVRSNVTAIFNGTDFSGNEFNMFEYAKDSHLILTNQAAVTANWNGGNLSALFTTRGNNLAEVLDGSKLTYVRTMWMGYGTAAATRLNNTLLVSGEGSVLDLTPASTYHLYIGVDQGGNVLVLEKGAQLKAYDFKMGGADSINANGTTRSGNDTAGGNAFIVRGEGTVAQITQSSSLGYGASHSNEIQVLDRAEFNIGSRTGGTWAGLAVGSGPAEGVASSWNAVVVSNASLVTRHVRLGVAAGSHDNRLEFLGPAPELYHTDNESWSMFGAGSNNVVHVGCGANFSFLQYNASFGTAGGADNRLVVDGGSACTLKNLTVGDSAHSFAHNAIEVTGGSCLTNSGNFTFVADRGRVSVTDGSAFWIAGSARFGATDFLTQGNEILVGGESTMDVAGGDVAFCSANTDVVISNGTLRVGDGYARNIKFGSADAKTAACGGTNVMLVLKGDHPVVTRRSTGAPIMNFACDSGIRFELPPEGYASAPLRDILQVQHEADFRLEVSGIEALQKNLRNSTTFTLIETTCDSGLLWLRNKPAILETANAKLPSGCFFSIDRTGGTDKLKLRVRAFAGLSIILR